VNYLLCLWTHASLSRYGQHFATGRGSGWKRPFNLLVNILQVTAVQFDHQYEALWAGVQQQQQQGGSTCISSACWSLLAISVTDMNNQMQLHTQT
jgi:hypothetical protein